MSTHEPEPPDAGDAELVKEYRIVEGDPIAFDPPTAEQLDAELTGYEVRELIGIGGMGAIYRGFQPQLERPVAIKVLKPSGEKAAAFKEHFRTEAQAMARMNHTHIIAVHDFGETDSGLLYIVMEFVDGEPLCDLIEKKRVSRDMAIDIMRQTCDALQYAHYQGVVHRDIKPANILISRSGEVKIADFGLAKLHMAGGGSRGLGDEPYGTAEYVAPEVMDDDAEVDHRADIFSLGVLFYELLVGQPPRNDAPRASELVRCDPRFDLLIASAMSPHPGSRYQQALDFKAALDGILAIPAPAPQAARPARPAAPAMAAPVVAAKPKLATKARPGRPAPGAPVAGTAARPVSIPRVLPTRSSANVWWVWTLAIVAVGALVGGYFFVKAQEEKRKRGPIRVIRGTNPEGSAETKDKAQPKNENPFDAFKDPEE